MKIGSTHSVNLASQNARAVGLVRKLEEGTFKGASIEKLTEKFAHRLTVKEEPVPSVTDPLAGPDALPISPAGTGEILDILA